MSNDMIQTLTHSKSGASCQIHAFGATVLSFKTANGKEHLFVSKEAKLDGSKAIRGGIPLVFPIFGPAPQGSTMPQHGFARNNAWQIKPDSLYDHDEVAGIAYTLNLKDASPESRGTGNPWSVEQAAVDGTDVRLTYEVILAPKSLTTTLIIENTGSDAFNFNALQHTYYAASEAHAKAAVHGLGGYSIIDKVDASNTGKTQTYDEDVVLLEDARLVDRVYTHPEAQPTVHVSIQTGSSTLKAEATGQVDESPVPVSCVVWNPGKENAAKMSDFGNDEYPNMICVEPGLLGHQPILNPGKEARLTQIILVE
jgi:glucose-6-phosphate 1-epimerase